MTVTFIREGVLSEICVQYIPIYFDINAADNPSMGIFQISCLFSINRITRISDHLKKPKKGNT